MRLRHLWIALTLLAVFASYSWGQSQGPSPSGTETSQQEQGKPAEAHQSTSAEQKASPPQPIIVHVEPAKKTEAETEEDRRERKEKADLDRRLVDLTAELSIYAGGLYSATVILAIATVALVIATIGLVVMAILQSRDIRTTQRAFVFVKKFNLDVITVADEPGWWVSVEWENSGSTPTREFFNRINVKTFVEEPGSDYTFPDQPSGDAIRGMIGPKAIEHSAIAKIPFSVIEGVRTKQRRLFVWGWAEYDDIFDGAPAHRIEFCDELTVDSTGMPTRRMYRRHNGADGECERKPRAAKDRSKPIT
jgi:hypothetical protein